MSTVVSIFRSKVDPVKVEGSSLVFTTGDILINLLNKIKQVEGPLSIRLHGCENMYNFRAILKDNFPTADIRHVGV